MGGDHHVASSSWTSMNLSGQVTREQLTPNILTHCFDAAVGCLSSPFRRISNLLPSSHCSCELFSSCRRFTSLPLRWFIAIILLGGWNSCWDQESLPSLPFFRVFLTLSMSWVLRARVIGEGWSLDRWRRVESSFKLLSSFELELRNITSGRQFFCNLCKRAWVYLEVH